MALYRRVVRNLDEFKEYFNDIDGIGKDNDCKVEHTGLPDPDKAVWPALILTFVDWSRGNNRHIVAQHAHISQQAMYVLLGIGPDALRMEVDEKILGPDPIETVPEERDI